MKKINIIFPLILVATLVSCKLGGFGIGVVTSKGKEDDAKQAVTAAEAEKEAILKELKSKRDGYKKRMDDLKAKFEKETSTQKKVTIPEQVIQATNLKESDQPKIHASLGYDSNTHENLNTAIAALNLNDDSELEMVSYLLWVLVSFEDSTRELFDKLLSDEMLEKIKNDKDALVGFKTEFDKLTGGRDAFIKIAQKSAQAAAVNKGNVVKVKEELKKIIAAATNPTPPSATE